ncbi:hypothetical protein A2Z22_01515 [Candidatus Woesebacteria bacterium RBG_16_34_12]|uniref:Uncharacterized protein n=1 Tax=Candidatus Woesebacteria bacterium RBG_16_34_12 TaxID=1802480 RepID=A0A1F7XA61_9BACT|nr:MAG: hypothetical protein A2Z22_01515 [Candidatus Woesebacteria bacterium RBG_16_34_12]
MIERIDGQVGLDSIVSKRKNARRAVISQLLQGRDPTKFLSIWDNLNRELDNHRVESEGNNISENT